MELSSIAKYLMSIGAFLLLLGSSIFFLSKLGISVGKLPGDILIQKNNFTFYFPLATSIIISIILTIIMSLIQKK